MQWPFCTLCTYICIVLVRTYVCIYILSRLFKRILCCFVQNSQIRWFLLKKSQQKFKYVQIQVFAFYRNTKKKKKKLTTNDSQKKKRNQTKFSFESFFAFTFLCFFCVYLPKKQPKRNQTLFLWILNYMETAGTRIICIPRVYK